jgi:hypothetical protein
LHAAVVAAALVAVGAVAVYQKHTRAVDIAREEPSAVPSPEQRAEEIRRVALDHCAEKRWQQCLDGLDEAKRLHPAGEDDPAVERAREAAAEASRPAPAPSNPPAPSETAPEEEVPNEPRQQTAPKAPAKPEAPKRPRASKKAKAFDESDLWQAKPNPRPAPKVTPMPEGEQGSVGRPVQDTRKTK